MESGPLIPNYFEQWRTFSQGAKAMNLLLAYLNKHWIAKKIDEASSYLHASSAAHTPKQIGQVRSE